MTDPYDLADAYDIPRGRVDQAGHMERIEAHDGTSFYVLESARTGERQLVHADVVEYDSPLEHPVTTGVIGLLTVGSGFVAPLIAGYEVASSAGSAAVTVGAVLAAVLGAWYVANLLLFRTPPGDWLFRFLEWNENRAILMARGETA